MKDKMAIALRRDGIPDRKPTVTLGHETRRKSLFFCLVVTLVVRRSQCNEFGSIAFLDHAANVIPANIVTNRSVTGFPQHLVLAESAAISETEFRFLDK